MLLFLGFLLLPHCECSDCHFHNYTALTSQALPGGYAIGDKVRSLINHTDKNGSIERGDIGTVRVRESHLKVLFQHRMKVSTKLL